MDPSDILKEKSPSQMGGKVQDWVGFLELRRARKRSSGKRQGERSRSRGVTVAVPGDRCLRKPSAHNFRETLAKLALMASAFHFSKPPLATSPSGSSSQRMAQRRVTQLAFLHRLRPTMPSRTPKSQLRPAVASSQGPSHPAPKPAPLSPQPQAAPPLNSRVVITHCK